jgi:hypothetical protein
MLNPSMGFELSEVSPSLPQPRLPPRQALLSRTSPSVGAPFRRSEDLRAGILAVGSRASRSEERSVVKPDSDV